MDISQFKKEFMDEAVKQSTVINNSLKTLKNQRFLVSQKSKISVNLDSKALVEMSRAAHILKSSSAARGYEQISNLSKAMEETLNEIIDKKIEINTAIRDVLTESVNVLAELIKAVDKGKKESNVSELVNKLKNIKQFFN